jgi:hypothetical protein
MAVALSCLPPPPPPPEAADADAEEEEEELLPPDSCSSSDGFLFFRNGCNYIGCRSRYFLGRFFLFSDNCFRGFFFFNVIFQFSSIVFFETSIVKI